MKIPELIVAMDVPTAADMAAAIDRLPDEVRWIKIGLELFAAEGPSVLMPTARRGRKVFLDLKLHDIPRTVARAIRAAAAHGVDMMTVHAAGGRAMLAAAAEAAAAAGPDRPRIVAVTVLTSLDGADLASIGVTRTPAEQVAALAGLAVSSGADGVVCSAREAGVLRARLGEGPLLVTPGLRLPAGAIGDQKRVATPAEAARAGADFLVVGRPILDADDPAAAARAVLADIASAARP